MPDSFAADLPDRFFRWIDGSRRPKRQRYTNIDFLVASASYQHQARKTSMTSVDIVAMPIAEKLKLMETLWDSLCVQSAGNMEMPVWHAELLEQRLRRLANGEEQVSPWNEAKERIRSQIKSH